MNLAPVGKPITFEVTFDNPGLFVAMSVYSMLGTPALISGPAAMTNLVGNTYFKQFTPPTENENYLILKAVYTDGTFTTLDTNYSQGTETIIAVDLAKSSQPQVQSVELQGEIDILEVAGEITSEAEIEGQIEDLQFNG